MFSETNRTFASNLPSCTESGRLKQAQDYQRAWSNQGVTFAAFDVFIIIVVYLFSCYYLYFLHIFLFLWYSLRWYRDTSNIFILFMTKVGKLPNASIKPEKNYIYSSLKAFIFYCYSECLVQLLNKIPFLFWSSILWPKRVWVSTFRRL